ncbi:catalase [Endozoicomonas elysicola]|uniref:Catalase n=1 Tax=Endozoicomonas elysicola TaxID=305900 RepID=A0A081K8N1_9GAMM|nr:catalase [Endozoicomonas elysicola]KEI70507.1 catalase [Endozoicomonas elysicola]
MTDNTYLTTANGAPVPEDNNSISAGERGSLTFDNYRLFEKLAHFNRERIPERVVHARGYGAHGTFTLTKDLSDLTIAKFMQGIDKKTDVFLRFSTVAGGQDSGDFVRDVRGFALRFYTEEGNYDIVGNNTPVFFLRDPAKFPDFIHSQKKDPRTNLPDPAHHFEFWASNPQSMHQITTLMSDRGIPKSLRHMNGYGSHTLSMWNDKGERVWVKWHFKTNQGIKTLTNEEAAKMPADGMQSDLVKSIDRGDFPSWAVKIQVMTEEQSRNYQVNPFDLTKVWPHTDFPLMEIGQLELNRNVDNYFAETEQAAFSPSNMVPGVGASPDKMLQGRLFAYADAHRYRIGANHQQLPVNRPQCPVHNYQRDGAMTHGSACPFSGHNQNANVNFYPNDREQAPKPKPEVAEPPMPLEENAWIKAYDTRDEDNYSQAGDLYRLMSEDQKRQLIGNIAGGLKQATESVQQRMIQHFTLCDADYGQRIQAALES